MNYNKAILYFLLCRFYVFNLYLSKNKILLSKEKGLGSFFYTCNVNKMLISLLFFFLLHIYILFALKSIYLSSKVILFIPLINLSLKHLFFFSFDFIASNYFWGAIGMRAKPITCCLAPPCESMLILLLLRKCRSEGECSYTPTLPLCGAIKITYLMF